MIESQTISKELPALTSMQYETLRELGIARIQELAGRLWTDYNTHDPGITILEALSFVLTDIGYRINYDIKDLLAQKLGSPDAYDIKNFYTACEILPVCPVTFNDFREIMIDTEIVDESGGEPQYFGVKNAWILKSPDAEHAIFVDRKKSKLRLSPPPGSGKKEEFHVKTLYDILLEFDRSDVYGDLNENTIEGEFVLYTFPALPQLQGLKIGITITFPHWDDPIDWQDLAAVQMSVEDVHLKFLDVPDGYSFTYHITNANKVVLVPDADSDPVPDLGSLTTQINGYIYDSEDALIVRYMEKIAIIGQIVEEVKRRLHDNRNLCDDFFRFSALKVEEILLCADIELDNQADVEETEAAIFHAISKFLSPTVYFYTLEEMLNKCAVANTYAIEAISPGEKIITVGTELKEDVGSEDIVSITGDEGIAGEYTVNCVMANELNPLFTDIHVEEEIASDAFAEGTVLFVGRIDDNLCRTVDEIFEGPKLIHGFIDEKELEAAQLTKVIHVSDLIRIIMDIKGVKAVRSIQIANNPQDKEDGIEERSVKWCLELAWEQNYVPRLSRDQSKLTYYKEQLPFLADDDEVNTLINAKEAEDRPQKIRYPKMDLPVPPGTFKNLEAYVSVQEEFPDIYGVGSSGIPDLSSLEGLKKAERLGKVKQLKGFLTFFDQLIANELAQLNHVKDLFSMNGEKNEFGEYKIDQTYFARPLNQIIPNGSELYVNESGHLVSLQNMVEDEALYIERRNRFLDHLLGRFAETFTDYALIVHKLDKENAGMALIEDKLQFLARYPAISAERGKGFNYRHPCLPWHIHNVSGVEQRSSFLLGMAERDIEALNFGTNFSIDPAVAGFTVSNNSGDPLLVHPAALADGIEVKELLERIVLAGLYRENYEIISEEGGTFSFRLRCDEEVLGLSGKKDYSSDGTGGDADSAIGELIAVFTEEHLTNHEANRKNMACPFENYFSYSLTADTSPAPPELPTYTFTYALYDTAFDFTDVHKVLEGAITEEVVLEETETLPLTEEQVLAKGGAQIHRLLWDIVDHAKESGQYLLDPALSPYRFQLCDRRGEIIGSSSQADFNALLADQIKSSDTETLMIVDSTANDGEYTITDAAARGPYIDIDLTTAPPSPAFDGKVIWEQIFAIETVDTEERSLKTSGNVSAHFLINDIFEIRNSSANDGWYTIRAIEEDGGKTVLKFWEPIASDTADGQVIDQHVFVPVGIDGNQITVKGGEDEKAIQKIIAFIRRVFYSHEGMHLIEHTLLRPRINEEIFVELSSGYLAPLGGGTAQLTFPKRSEITGIDAGTNTIALSTNIKAEIHGDLLHIEGGPYTGRVLQVEKITTQAGKSKIKVKEDLTLDLPQAPFENGEVRYEVRTTVTKIKPITSKITVEEASVMEVREGDVITLEQPEKEPNNGQFEVEEVIDTGSGFDLQLRSGLQLVQDDLLPIHLDQDCEGCRITDVYSCIATVILPYWAGRFINIDFRKFVERSIRRETPAHILLNICWINCEHMEVFEKAYKTWLLEINRPVWDKSALSAALNAFIEALTASRNVYPKGTLHSCDEDESLEGAIILNNSVLGT